MKQLHRTVLHPSVAAPVCWISHFPSSSRHTSTTIKTNIFIQSMPAPSTIHKIKELKKKMFFLFYLLLINNSIEMEYIDSEWCIDVKCHSIDSQFASMKWQYILMASALCRFSNDRVLANRNIEFIIISFHLHALRCQRIMLDFDPFGNCFTRNITLVSEEAFDTNEIQLFFGEWNLQRVEK